MKHLTHCPECGSELHEAAGIAIYCPNDDCPVADDPALWDGKGNKAESPIKLTLKGDGEFGLSLDEFKRLQKLIKQQAERIERLTGLLGVSICPQCDGSGAYYDGYGEVCQCQFCYERYIFTALDKESDELKSNNRLITNPVLDKQFKDIGEHNANCECYFCNPII